MNSKRAKKIRKIISSGLTTHSTGYTVEQHPFTLQTGEGAKQFATETLRAPMGRRAYQLGKKIYKRFGVMPKVQP